MASGSIFTFDTDPQRVSSPWLAPEDSGRRSNSDSGQIQPGHLSDYGVTKLEAEPQEGPTEYKLHLLLRPRRTYTAMSTISSTQNSRIPASRSKIATAALSASSQSRQVRLQQLTTQLLWRLQQSCAYHALNPKDLIIPKLPDDTDDLSLAMTPQKPLPGLEESRGALYEIGVADDGTLVGLTKDEMDESITTLKVMAATLGCRVEILRHVIVGECEWLETSELVDSVATQPAQIARQARLWVVEALVTPDYSMKNGHPDGSAEGRREVKESPRATESVVQPSRGRSTTDQLRITLTGPTTSGKSTLLGTLSTGTVDNGRGKSRISLFKHRHEVASGLTSSVAQELIGYKDRAIFNYSQDHVESWIDIHDSAENGRLVFVSDSAGHPRYRRTILRGLFGWAPQWTILCLAADDTDASSTKDGASSTANDVLGVAGAGVDLAKAHLELCLKLKTPLAIVITKMDLATKASLHRILGQLLTHIKAVGRVPKILQPAQGSVQEWTAVPSADLDKVKAVTTEMDRDGDLLKFVPIILTSAVSGAGIGMTHALLESLPLPPVPTANDYVGMALNPEQPSCLFHIDDTFSLPASYASLAENPDQNDMGTVVSGYLRFGQLSVGDSIIVGPFPSGEDDFKGMTPEDRASPGNYGLSISHPSSAELAKIAIRNTVAASTIQGEWHKAKIVSIRNLRLPVNTLEAGQVGTIGIVLEMPQEKSAEAAFETPLAAPRIRKGMVLAIPSKHMADTGMSLQAASGLTVSFRDPNTASLAYGSLVNVYVGSVRAAARVKGVSKLALRNGSNKAKPEETEDIFDMNEHDEAAPTYDLEFSGGVQVTLELLTSREWVEMGSQILVLEGGRNDRSGLEGFVGTVVEIVD
ncbi:GTP-binding protein [Colletotrichum scovillei]|uniref:GTP-binding protein n=1 Tax=Colletotrichum scovillei TaxID=1209932 RepID=A0A9P7R531_9PEZI|nr:GTP-binding protein [Colletotrichum scovillei]KAF4781751.1 GTP-binding protein [Colletotrichum scovillei]KAG7050367.1 GTP-binding protein [Colletotrichum scovillei]KAG7069409.1 GTP-binding protein [Colletotrichum scovillei]KAG7073325.1 GTP-binding protein [Colletotrichum scovillei]